MNNDFINQISNGNASIKSRQHNTSIVLENTELAKDLIEMAVNIEDKFHFKAVWIIEKLVEKNIELLTPFIDKILETAPKYKHESAVRGISRTIHFLSKSKKIKLSEKQENRIVEICFDWLINPKIKLAPKVFAIYSLEEMSKKQPWILKELTPIVEKDAESQSPSYRAAARKILKKTNL